MTPFTAPSPELLSLLGIGCVSIFGAVKLLNARRAGTFARSAPTAP